PDQGSAAGSAAGVEKKPDPGKPTPKPQPNTGGRSEKNDVAMTEDDSAAWADKLTREGPNGTDVGDMSDRNPNTDLGKQVDAVKEGNKTVNAGGGGRVSRGDGDPRVGTGKGPKINAPGGIDSAGGGKQTEK